MVALTHAAVGESVLGAGEVLAGGVHPHLDAVGVAPRRLAVEDAQVAEELVRELAVHARLADALHVDHGHAAARCEELAHGHLEAVVRPGVLVPLARERIGRRGEVLLRELLRAGLARVVHQGRRPLLQVREAGEEVRARRREVGASPVPEVGVLGPGVREEDLHGVGVVARGLRSFTNPQLGCLVTQRKGRASPSNHCL